MAASLPDPARVDLLPRAERMAKADLRKAENNDAGHAIARAQKLCDWSLKEFAGHAKRGERQLARWIDGTEHPQLDTLFAIEAFRKPLVVALAERAGLGVDVQTVVTIRLVA